MEQPKMERLLRFRMLLSGSVNYTKKEVMEDLGISERTFLRYIDTFRCAGFEVGIVSEGLYRISKESRFFPDLSKTISLTPEEAAVVNCLIDELAVGNALKIGLKRKLSVICGDFEANMFLDNKMNALNVSALNDAMRNKEQVQLKDYRSSKSKAPRDYVVEPFRFETNGTDFWAYDIEARENKHFRLARLNMVRHLDKDWEYEREHRVEKPDDFRFHGPQSWHVRLRMDLMARNLLVEEYPLSVGNLKRVGDGEWLYEADVYSLLGVGRFVMGLADHITVLECEELKEFMISMAEIILENNK